jgi:hypothetical protein
MSIMVNDIVMLASEEFGVSRLDLLSPRRASKIAAARIAVYGLARYWTSKSYPQIGKVLGRDHTSVLYGVRRFEETVRRDPDFERRVRKIEIVLAYLSLLSACPSGHASVHGLVQTDVCLPCHGGGRVTKENEPTGDRRTCAAPAQAGRSPNGRERHEQGCIA